MTEQTTSQYSSPGSGDRQPSRLATGFIMFAGVLMIMAGGFQAFGGLVALFQDEFYVATRNYLLQFDTTSWGWIHLLLGLLVLFAGFAVMSGKTWGRVVGIILAVVSALANFAFIPYYTFWSLIIIALDVFIIWARQPTAAMSPVDQQPTDGATLPTAVDDARTSPSATTLSAAPPQASGSASSSCPQELAGMP